VSCHDDGFCCCKCRQYFVEDTDVVAKDVSVHISLYLVDLNLSVSLVLYVMFYDAKYVSCAS
jgi:hypothetical protein